MANRLKYLIFPVLTLILEILPYGAVCNFARLEENGSIGANRVLFSYFDPLPIGYAHVSPFFTALMTCVIVLIVIFYCINGSLAVANVGRKWIFVCTIVSACPILLGIQYCSLVGFLITLSLIGEYLLIRFQITHKKA